MRNVSNLLWCDLKNNAQRVEFLRSGRAHETGIINQSIVDEIADAYELLDVVLADLQSCQNYNEQLLAKAKAYDEGQKLWVSFDVETGEPYAIDRDPAITIHDTWKLLGRHPQGNMPGGFVNSKVRVCKEVVS